MAFRAKDPLILLLINEFDIMNREESHLGPVSIEASLHPVLPLGLLIEDENGVALLECQFLSIIGAVVIQGMGNAPWIDLMRGFLKNNNL